MENLDLTTISIIVICALLCLLRFLSSVCGKKAITDAEKEDGMNHQITRKVDALVYQKKKPDMDELFEASTNWLNTIYKTIPTNCPVREMTDYRSITKAVDHKFKTDAGPYEFVLSTVEYTVGNGPSHKHVHVLKVKICPPRKEDTSSDSPEESEVLDD